MKGLIGLGRRLATPPGVKRGGLQETNKHQQAPCNAPHQKARLGSTELLSLQRSDVVEIVSGPGDISSDDSGRIHSVYSELDTTPVFQSHLNLVPAATFGANGVAPAGARETRCILEHPVMAMADIVKAHTSRIPQTVEMARIKAECTLAQP